MTRRIAGAIGGAVAVAAIAVIALLATGGGDEPAGAAQERRLTRAETPAVKPVASEAIEVPSPRQPIEVPQQPPPDPIAVGRQQQPSLLRPTLEDLRYSLGEARVHFTSFEIQESAISLDAAKQVLARATSKLERCFSERRAVKPDVDRHALVLFVVAPDGTAPDFGVSSEDKPLGACMESALAGTRFPRPSTRRMATVGADLEFR
jgi:hypothetical protein